jgi:auxin efflux carrier family protein
MRQIKALRGDGDEEQERQENGGRQDDEEAQAEDVDERTSLLPDGIAREYHRIHVKSLKGGCEFLAALPPWIQKTLVFFCPFTNAPLIGAGIGAVIGIAPPLHKAFFADTNRGGFFDAWLSTSVKKKKKNIGSLFATQQVVVVGFKLSSSLRKMKRGEESGSVP